MTSTEHAVLFAVLDEYSRHHYRCFVSELFLSPSLEEYVVCFRPLATEHTDPYRAFYLYLPRTEAELAVAEAGLTGGLKEAIDARLTDH